MSEFSELLDWHIGQAGFSESQLAVSSGFSRSYIAKLKNGQRVSPDEDKMKKLFACLHLSQTEYTKLWNRYLEERQGKERYALIRSVLDFVSSFRQVSRLSAKVKIDCVLPDVAMVRGKEDVGWFLKLLMEQEALKPEGYLKILAQPECGNLMEVLKGVFKINPEFRVDHLVCLNNNTKKGANRYYNIELLQKIIPAVLCRQISNYTVYYHYDRVEAHLNQFNIMPYLILTKDRAIQMDYEFEHAVVCREPEKVEYLSQVFQEMQKNCLRLYELNMDESSILQCWMKTKQVIRNVYAVMDMPCITMLDITEFIYKYVNSQRDELTMAMRQMYDLRKRIIGRSVKLISFFTKAGIRRFIESGRVGEIPAAFYQPLKRADCCRMLQKLLDATEQGYYEPRLIREDQYQWPKEVGINLYNYEEMALYYDLDTGQNVICMEEKTSAGLFYDFMETFRESAYVYSVEETVEYLKRLVASIERDGKEVS